MRLRIVFAAVGFVFAIVSPAAAFDPLVEAQNYNKGQERQTIYNTLQYQTLLRQVSLQNRIEATQMQAADPERNFMAQLCATGEDGCAGDVRLYDWGPRGYGIVKPVLFTARSGATLSGHVWATKAGPAKRPGIVITNGSVQAPERVYWFVAQTLAKAGYVVFTWDPQNQGQSDSFGEAPDQQEGFPAQTDGRPFFDGTEDAINFFLSTPDHPYKPVPSCNSGTSHAAKQNRRVAAGLDAPYNPLYRQLNPSKLGIAGHSYGAAGVSYIGQWDPRVDTIVAWDNLAAPDPNQSTGASGGGPEEKGCVDPSQRTVPPIKKPALGMSADYFIPPAAQHLRPRPAGQEPGVAGLLGRGRRHRRDHHPRRNPLRLRLGPERGIPGDSAGRGRDQLVHDRMVRQVPEGRLHRRPPAADRPLASRRSGGGDRSAEPRRQHVQLLLPVAARHPSPQRPALHEREPA